MIRTVFVEILVGKYGLAACLSLVSVGLPAALCAEPSLAQTANGPPAVFQHVPVKQTQDTTLTKLSISSAGAQRMIDAVTAEAERQHHAVTVVIVDEGGGLVAVKRMDGANLGSVQAAMAKASTAVKLGLPTGTFLENGPPNIPIATAFISAGFTLLAGGQPIEIGGTVIGAIAVSGTGNDKDYINIAFGALGQASPARPPH